MCTGIERGCCFTLCPSHFTHTSVTKISTEAILMFRLRCNGLLVTEWGLETVWCLIEQVRGRTWSGKICKQRKSNSSGADRIFIDKCFPSCLHNLSVLTTEPQPKEDLKEILCNPGHATKMPPTDRGKIFFYECIEMTCSHDWQANFVHDKNRAEVAWQQISRSVGLPGTFVKYMIKNWYEQLNKAGNLF